VNPKPERKQTMNEQSNTTHPEAREALQALCGRVNSVMLATQSAEHVPDVSYAPVRLDNNAAFMIYVSTLSRHTHNLKAGGECSVMLIDDESRSEQLFARPRLTFNCGVEAIERDTEAHKAWMADFTKSFGKIMNVLGTMADFQFFRLKPLRRGRLVYGFGRAFDVDPADWTVLTPAGGGGQGGHQHSSRSS
jgi:putative heme iron utilization protein